MNGRLILVLIAGCAAQAGEGDIRPAVSKSVALLQTAGKTWFAKQSCVSCHQQSLPMMLLDTARRRNVAVDQPGLEELVTRSFGYLTDLDQAVQGSYVIDPVMGDGYTLAAAAPLGLPRSAATGAYARLIARRQLADGHWVTFDVRPPQSCSVFTATATGIRALQLYLPEQMESERRDRVKRAALWLSQAVPRDTEDRVYQLFGLGWADTGPVAKYGGQLLAEQREDGGWSQLPDRASDAYATGEALAALHQAAGIPASHPAYQKGLAYLLRTQKPDGTWFVSSRVHPPAPLSPPYFESGLPYGHDQFISAMGTAWAGIALLLALPETSTPPAPLKVASLQPANVPVWAEKVLFGGTGDIQRLLDSGWDPNSATSKGTSALMMAAPDFEKAQLLIEHGARVNARSRTGYTPLMIAASHRATDSVRLMLDRNAEVRSPKGQPALLGASPLFFAAWSGDVDSMTALRKAGGDISQRMLLAGLAANTPLEMASTQGDSEMVAALIQNGAPVDEEDRDTAVSTLDWAVFRNDVKQARLLISRKADVNHVDKLGYTPLLWAANVDFGDTGMLELLLEAGADPRFRNKEGLTALQLAVRHNHARHKTVLEKAAVARAAASR